jgi:hypothetical protein
MYGKICHLSVRTETNTKQVIINRELSKMLLSIIFLNAKMVDLMKSHCTRQYWFKLFFKKSWSLYFIEITWQEWIKSYLTGASWYIILPDKDRFPWQTVFKMAKEVKISCKITFELNQNKRPGLICRDQSSILKFILAPIFYSKKSSLILSKN